MVKEVIGDKAFNSVMGSVIEHFNMKEGNDNCFLIEQILTLVWCVIRCGHVDESSSLFQNLGRNYSRLRFPSPDFLLLPAFFSICMGQFKGYNPFHFLALSQFVECYALSKMFAAILIRYYICLSWAKLVDDSYYRLHL